jgi:UMP-CMP kinase
MTQVYVETGITKFLIDGFPRSQGNADAWNATMSNHTTEFLLSFECPEEVLVGRLLERAKTSGRTDDKVEVIRKRFQTFLREEAPIVKIYEKQGLVKRIASDKPVEDIYAEVSKHFVNL